MDETGFVHVAAGFRHNLTIKNDGTVWSWGRNDDGQLGTGSVFTALHKATQALNLSDAVAIAGGMEHSLVVLADGSVWSYGSNEWGELGNGTAPLALEPVPTLLTCP